MTCYSLKNTSCKTVCVLWGTSVLQMDSLCVTLCKHKITDRPQVCRHHCQDMHWAHFCCINYTWYSQKYGEFPILKTCTTVKDTSALIPLKILLFVLNALVPLLLPLSAAALECSFLSVFSCTVTAALVSWTDSNAYLPQSLWLWGSTRKQYGVRFHDLGGWGKAPCFNVLPFHWPALSGSIQCIADHTL